MIGGRLSHIEPMADIHTVYNECIGCAYNPDIHVTDVTIHFIVIVKG